MAGVSAGPVIDRSRPTTCKTRVVAGEQQLARLDRECTAWLTGKVASQLSRWVRRAVGEVDACVLSDYAKGVLSEDLIQDVITKARGAGIPIVVDPKSTSLERYHGATVVTPNLLEARRAAGLREGANVEDFAPKLLTSLGGAALLITRGPEGMSLFRPHRDPLHLAAVRRPVFDRTGAGDTVVAVLGPALGAGLGLSRAAAMANHAAGIVVGKPGVAVVTREDVGLPAAHV
jgi:rfaE bifunctional protein kinase chain/domain